MGLRGRISFFAVIGIVTFSVAFIIAAQLTIKRSTDALLSERLVFTVQIAQHIDQVLRHFLDHLKFAAMRKEINLQDDDFEPEKHLLHDLYSISGIFSDGVALLNSNGEVLLVEGGAYGRLARLSLSDDLLVRKTLSSGKPGIYTYEKSPFSGAPAVAFHYPVKDEKGSVTGAIWAGERLPIPMMHNLLKQLKIGLTGYAKIVDGNYFVLASTKPERLFKKSEHSEALSKLFPPRKAAIIEDYDIPEGKTFSLAVAPNAEANWWVIVEQEPLELHMPLIMLRRRFIFIGGLGLAMALAFVFITTARIVRPIRALTDHAKRIAAGELGVPVSVKCSGEVGALSASFEEMRKKLKESTDALARSRDELEERVKTRTRELSLLNQVASTIIQTIDPEEMLQKALDVTIAAFDADAGLVLLVDPSGKLISLKVAKGVSEKLRSAINSAGLDKTMASRALKERAPVAATIDDYPDPELKLALMDEGLTSFASAPLISKGEALGGLSISRRQRLAFSTDEMSNLAAVVNQIAIALENALLFRQISEAKEELEAAMRGLKEAQAGAMRSEKMAAIGRMAAGLVHELKQPLSIITMHLQLMAQDAGISPEMRNQLEALSGQVRRLSKIVDNLRRFSRQEKPEIAQVEVNKAIEETLALVEYEMRIGDIELVKELDESAAIIYADRDQLSQVFLNLISNARDAMPGGGRLIIKSEKLMKEDEDWVRITFSDTGHGIPEVELGKIFDPFYTTKPPEKGTGLGLSVCLGIIEGHGGSINVESQVGRGSSFIIELPRGDRSRAHGRVDLSGLL